MPQKQTSLIRTTSAALIASAVILIIIVAAMVYLVYRTQDYVEGAAEARRVRSAAADLLISVQNAESGQRGYLLTAENTFLEPYVEAVRVLAEREKRLDDAMKASRFVEIEFGGLKKTVDAKLVELRQTLALAQAGKRDSAIQIVKNETGLALMNEIRRGLSDIVEESDQRVIEQFSNQVSLALMLRVVTIVGALFIIGIILTVFLIIRRYIQEILAARLELEGMNVGLEQRVRERTEDLIQANQEIQRFAYIVTHDLRAPLVNIMGFTAELDSALQSIRKYFSAGDEVQREEMKSNTLLAVNEDLPEAIGFIRTSTRKMDDLINAILKISRDGRRPLKPEKIDLAELIETAAGAIQHQVQEASGEVTVNLPVQDIVSDRFSLQQVLGNLLDNAVKYRNPAIPLRINIDAYAMNPFTIGLRITDNGRGIAEEDHERIFELFRRSGTQDRPGEGIGLAHVRSLIRNMGGDIGVKSELGKGTVFDIRLPRDLSRFVGSAG